MSYYTPSLDEFHQGFTYQQNVNGEWKDLTFRMIPQFDILSTRVKYLDEDDIMNCGFRYIQNRPEGKIFRKDLDQYNSIDGVELCFYRKYDEPFISLSYSNGDGIVDDLNVKNVNELRWILTRYGMVGNHS